MDVPGIIAGAGFLTALGIDKTINVLDEDGTTVHQLVFQKGLLTSSTEL